MLPRPSSFSLGTSPGDLWGHVGMRAQGWRHPAGSWSPAPGHQQATPLPWDPQRPEQSRQSCPGGADVSHQAALVFGGLGGGRVSPSQGSPKGVFLLAPQVQQDVSLPSACWSGAGLGLRSLQAEGQRLNRA